MPQESGLLEKAMKCVKPEKGKYLRRRLGVEHVAPATLGNCEGGC